MEKHIIQVAPPETATGFVRKFLWNADGNFTEIWSTDWFVNPQLAKAKLLEAVNKSANE